MDCSSSYADSYEVYWKNFELLFLRHVMDWEGKMVERRNCLLKIDYYWFRLLLVLGLRGALEVPMVMLLL